MSLALSSGECSGMFLLKGAEAREVLTLRGLFAVFGHVRSARLVAMGGTHQSRFAQLATGMGRAERLYS